MIGFRWISGRAGFLYCLRHVLFLSCLRGRALARWVSIELWPGLLVYRRRRADFGYRSDCGLRLVLSMAAVTWVSRSSWPCSCSCRRAMYLGIGGTVAAAAFRTAATDSWVAFSFWRQSCIWRGGRSVGIARPLAAPCNVGAAADTWVSFVSWRHPMFHAALALRLWASAICSQSFATCLLSMTARIVCFAFTRFARAE